MSAYGLLIALHVVVAVVGIGMLGAIPLGAHVARRAGFDLVAFAPWYAPLFGITRASLVVMLLTGLALDAITRGIHHERGWFQAACVLWLVIGFFQGRARVALRRGLSGQLDRVRALVRVEVFGWLTSAVVVAIAVLMKLKPF
jgi:hypothetical protein